jgi:hypothetical protein
MVIIIFLLALVLLKIFFFKEINLDFIIILSSILVLLMILYEPPVRKELPYKEGFTTDITQAEISKIKFLNGLLTDSNLNSSIVSANVAQTKPIDTQSILGISQDLQVLITTYGGQSYNGIGNTLYNISMNKNCSPDNICTPQGIMATKNFTFEDQEASYTETKGLFLGNNRVSGPMSLNLGISGNGEFSLFVICRPDELSLGKQTVNIFKIYGNTDNNNGMSLNIEGVVSSPTQAGKLSLNFDAQTFVSGLIPMDPNVVYTYVILKKPASVRIVMYSSISATPVEVLNAKLNASDVLFSNKTMCINCYSNWYAYLRSFGAYNVYLSDAAVKNIYSYMIAEETKLDDAYKKYQATLASISASLAKLKNCPYDATTCGKCTAVQDWTVIQDVINSDPTCIKAIDTYCSAHTGEEICKCWNPKSDVYNTLQCKNYRNIFKQQPTTMDTADIEKLDCKTFDAIKNNSALKETCNPTTTNTVNPATTGALLTVGLNPPSNFDKLLTQSNNTYTVPPITPTPVPTQSHSISVPVKPTPHGFMSWLTSWF